MSKQFLRASHKGTNRAEKYRFSCRVSLILADYRFFQSIWEMQIFTADVRRKPQEKPQEPAENRRSAFVPLSAALIILAGSGVAFGHCWPAFCFLPFVTTLVLWVVQ